MATNYPGLKASSRVKDLVDLVVLAHTQTVDLADLSTSIEAKRALSNIDPFDRFHIPRDWHRTYPDTAKGVPIAEKFTADDAAALVAPFIDPALTRSMPRATWDPHTLTWNR
ncbi:hypothetical protein ACFWQC_06140 [Nocardioides sp. NPDC058538]|uniref:hypothetical protein n=1 Tax=Nocardioides sp. NPDC058538 TaxID=3346542 RepID=UPI0036637C7E